MGGEDEAEDGEDQDELFSALIRSLLLTIFASLSRAMYLEAKIESGDFKKTRSCDPEYSGFLLS